MSLDGIETWHVDQFSANVIQQFQQCGTRLRGTIREHAITGAKDFWTRVGPTTAVKKTVRHGDTPRVVTPLSERLVTLDDWEYADLIDWADRYKVLLDPQAEYVVAGGNALGRVFDATIISAFDADAFGGENSGTITTFVSEGWDHVLTQAFSVADLIQASEDLNNADAPEEGRHIVLPPSGFSHLFRESDNLSLTDVDRANIKALVNGEIDSFMGFTFHKSNLLPSPAPNLRYAYAWHEAALGLSISEDLKTVISERADKSYSVQVKVSASLGAARIQGNGVVRFTYDERVP